MRTELELCDMLPERAEKTPSNVFAVEITHGLALRLIQGNTSNDADSKLSLIRPTLNWKSFPTTYGLQSRVVRNEI